MNFIKGKIKARLKVSSDCEDTCFYMRLSIPKEEGYYGLRVHEEALAYGVKVTGATVHFVNEIPDGGRILLQKAVEIQEGDTAENLQKRVMEQAEWKILPAAAEMVCREMKGATL